MGIGDFSNRLALFAENQQYRLRALPHFTIRWRQIVIFFSNVGQGGEHPLVCSSIHPTIHPFSAARPGKYGPCGP